MDAPLTGKRYHLTSHSIINIQVGEKFFAATYELLTINSRWFEAHLRRREDPSYDSSFSTSEPLLYLDRDGYAFQHLLRFFRTGVLPTFQLPDGSLDVSEYEILLFEARFYECFRAGQAIFEKCGSLRVKFPQWYHDLHG